MSLPTSSEPVKPTPGPWVSRGRYIGTPNHMSYIAECRDQNGNWSNEPMALANARLIAAAPDLLEALKAAVAVADRDTNEFNLAHSAIAKAEGRS